MLLSPRICLVQKTVFQKNQCDLRSQRALGYHIESSHEIVSFVHTIRTDYGFKGQPLKKDFPLVGFMELSFSIILKALQYKKVSLVQEQRNFTFLNPWSTDCFFIYIRKIFDISNKFVMNLQTKWASFFLRLIRKTPRFLRHYYWLWYYTFLSLPGIIFYPLLYLSFIDRLFFRLVLLVFFIYPAMQLPLTVIIPLTIFLKIFDGIFRMAPFFPGCNDGPPFPYEILGNDEPKIITPIGLEKNTIINPEMPKVEVKNTIADAQDSRINHILESVTQSMESKKTHAEQLNNWAIQKRGNISLAMLIVGVFGLGIGLYSAIGPKTMNTIVINNDPLLIQELKEKDDIIASLQKKYHPDIPPENLSNLNEKNNAELETKVIKSSSLDTKKQQLRFSEHKNIIEELRKKKMWMTTIQPSQETISLLENQTKSMAPHFTLRDINYDDNEANSDAGSVNSDSDEI